MKVKINLKYIIRLYDIEDFIKLLKCRFSSGNKILPQSFSAPGLHRKHELYPNKQV